VCEVGVATHYNALRHTATHCNTLQHIAKHHNTPQHTATQRQARHRPTQSIMYVPLQVNRFQKSILLIVQYKYLKSCSGDFYSLESDPPHKIMRYWIYYSTQLCFGFPPDRICQVEMICIGGVPVLKRHFGGAGP